MKLPGAGGQQKQDFLYNADTLLTGSTAQLALGRSQSRSVLLLQNTSQSNSMYVEIGFGTAHATLSGNSVSSVTIDNAGFNYTKPPVIRFLGGGGPTPFLGLNQPNGLAPTNPATGVAVLSGSSISSVVIENGGSGYLIAPYVQIIGSDLDPYGCATPSSSSGMVLPAAMTAPIAFNGVGCPTDPVAVTGTSGDRLLVRWMD